MRKKEEIQKVTHNLSRRLGKKLAAKLGKSRLLDISTVIAEYEEQVGWPNTPHEIRRLTDKIRYIPAEFGINLGSLRLSKKSTLEVNAALWGTLKSVFSALNIQPSEFIPS